MNHIKELQKELQIEIKRRMEAERTVFLLGLDEKYGNEYNRSNIVITTPFEPCCLNPHFDISDDHLSLEKLIERANVLLGTHNPHHQNSHQKLLTYEHSRTTNELIIEFKSLLEAFYTEQRENDASKDIIWLFEELERRFEEIKRSYEDERFDWECKCTNADSLTGEDRRDESMNEWRACLEELVEIVKRKSVGEAGAFIRKQIPPLQNKYLTDLQNQFSSVDFVRKQKCRNINQEMETMEQSYQVKLDEMSKTIEKQQMTIVEQCNKIMQLQQNLEAQKSRCLQERHSHHMNRESMAARIRYLEEIIRSSNNLENSRSKRMYTKLMMIPQSKESPNDLASVSAVKSENNKSTASQDTDIGILSLQQQIRELGAALQKSEEQRAKQIDEFQVEREAHLRQFEDLIDDVREFLDSNNVNIKGGCAP